MVASLARARSVLRLTRPDRRRCPEFLLQLPTAFR